MKQYSEHLKLFIKANKKLINNLNIDYLLQKAHYDLNKQEELDLLDMIHSFQNNYTPDWYIIYISNGEDFFFVDNDWESGVLSSDYRTVKKFNTEEEAKEYLTMDILAEVIEELHHINIKSDELFNYYVLGVKEGEKNSNE